MRRNEKPHNASLHHQGVANGALATEATVEPAAAKPATAKAATTKPASFESLTPKPLAETAIPEVVGALPTRAPGIEVLLALSPLHAGLVILRQLVKVRLGRGGTLAPQLTLRPARRGTLEIPSPRRRLGVPCLGTRLHRVPRAVIPLRPPI